MKMIFHSVQSSHSWRKNRWKLRKDSHTFRCFSLAIQSVFVVSNVCLGQVMHLLTKKNGRQRCPMSTPSCVSLPFSSCASFSFYDLVTWTSLLSPRCVVLCQEILSDFCMPSRSPANHSFFHLRVTENEMIEVPLPLMDSCHHPLARETPSVFCNTRLLLDALRDWVSRQNPMPKRQQRRVLFSI